MKTARSGLALATGQAISAVALICMLLVGRADANPVPQQTWDGFNMLPKLIVQGGASAAQRVGFIRLLSENGLRLSEPETRKFIEAHVPELRTYLVASQRRGGGRLDPSIQDLLRTHATSADSLEMTPILREWLVTPDSMEEYRFVAAGRHFGPTRYAVWENRAAAARMLADWNDGESASLLAAILQDTSIDPASRSEMSEACAGYAARCLFLPSASCLGCAKVTHRSVEETRRAGYLALCLYASFLGASTAHAQMFDSEVIRVHVDKHHAQVTGSYLFRRGAAASDVGVWYPFPGPDGPRIRRVLQCKIALDGNPERNLRFTRGEGGIHWILPFQSADSCWVRVRYEETLTQSKFLYLVRTALSWQRPLARARFEVVVPKTLDDPRFSYPFQLATSERRGDRLYVWESSPFIPEQDLVLRWGNPRTTSFAGAPTH